MREFEYTLKAEVNGEKNPYSGFVKIKLPKFIERNKMLRDISLKRSDAGESEVSSNLDSLDKMSEIVASHVLMLEVRKGGKVFCTLDELECDNNYTLFVLDVGTAIIQGVDLGNDCKPK